MLPKGFTVGMKVFKVLPEVIIFDGEVPLSFINQRKWDDDTDDLPPEMPLPDPLPETAFGHIRPKDWLPSVSEPIELQEGEGLAYAVSAKVVDAPLVVLPGREKELSSFISKVCVSYSFGPFELVTIYSVFVRLYLDLGELLLEY